MMNGSSILAFAAALLCLLLAPAAVIRKHRSFASWSFSVGMILFALECVFGGLSLQASSMDDVGFWQTLVLVTKSVLPGVWLAFSLTYSRANYREFLTRAKLLVLGAFCIPLFTLPALSHPIIGVAAYEPPEQGLMIGFGTEARIVNALILIATILILMNLERTFRATAGATRWRIKFLAIGLTIIFGARIYTRSQGLLFRGYSLGLTNIETAALLVGCVLVAGGYIRSGFTESDIYLSRAVLRTSVTLILCGAYLFVVGVFAQIVAHFGGAPSVPLVAFLVLLGIAALAVLLLSDRVRQTIESFVSRHFKRPEHDFRQIWTRFTRKVSAVLEEPDLCAASSRLISDTFNAMAVSVWLLDKQEIQLSCVFSTVESKNNRVNNSAIAVSAEQLKAIGLWERARPFELENASKQWRHSLGDIGTGIFPIGGNRICVPLRAGDRWLGLLVLADRVKAVPYTNEEMDLLQCLGDDVAASLLNIRLTTENMERKELELFQTMSTFFIHDLKNAASTLGLTLQNLPTHFDDPAFREDALRGMTATADRINQMISRLSAFREELRPKPNEIDLNLLVTETLRGLNGAALVNVVTKFETLPTILADRNQLQSVITNLVLNARDAAGPEGKISIETKTSGQWVTLSVSDNGCGMSAAFVRDSLFRPFQTTKKKGLGVGMFQTKMIVEAHRGSIQVRSEPGQGTTFEVILPLDAAKG
jgi:putative PEP-CTERM system histidine kinase